MEAVEAMDARWVIGASHNQKQQVHAADKEPPLSADFNPLVV